MSPPHDPRTAGATPPAAWPRGATALLAELRGVAVRRPGGMAGGATEAGAAAGGTAGALIAGLDWTIRGGERWAVIGRNAAGKSTLLRTLAGLHAPAAGSVVWAGRALDEWDALDAAAHRAWMPQQAQDRFRLSVSRLLELSRCSDAGLSVQQALDELDAGALLRRDARSLSGGERQRVALAQVLVQGARLWLLDEPVAFQDPAHQAQVAQVLRRHVPHGAGASVAAGGHDASGALGGRSASPGMHDRAAVFSAHDVNWVAAVATHVLALLGDGRWHAGPVEAMLTTPMLRAVYGCDWRQAGGAWIPLA